MEELKKQILKDEELASVSGGNDGMGINTMDVTTESMADTVMVVKNAAGANVRTAPSTDESVGRILYNLPNGSKVTVDGKTSNGWYRIQASDPLYGGQTAGYISGNLLVKDSGPSQGPGTGGPTVISGAPYFR